MILRLRLTAAGGLSEAGLLLDGGKKELSANDANGREGNKQPQSNCDKSQEAKY